MRHATLARLLVSSFVASAAASAGCSATPAVDAERLGVQRQAAHRNDPGVCDRHIHGRTCDACDCDAECGGPGVGNDGQCVGADPSQGIRGVCNYTNRCDDIRNCLPPGTTQCDYACTCDSECSPGSHCVIPAGQRNGSCRSADPQTDCTCGNGVVDPGESCDDGNHVDGDGCDRHCVLETCGNGVLDPGEECDDGNRTSGDGCDRACLIEVGCGNGRVEPGEECDDGNRTDGDGCSANCMREPTTECGNGVLEPGEECDDPGSPTCTTSCTCACGDVSTDIDPSHYNCNFRATGQVCFRVVRDDVTINCGGNAIFGNGAGFAVVASNRSGVHVENCTIEGFTQGVTATNAGDRNVVRNNTIRIADGDGFSYGIRIEGPRWPDAPRAVNGTLIDNNIITSDAAAYPYAIDFGQSADGTGNVISNNDIRTPGRAAYSYPVAVKVESASDVRVYLNKIESGGAAIRLTGAERTSVDRNSVVGGSIGILNEGSTGGRLSDNDVTNAKTGFYFIHAGRPSSGNVLRRNIVAKLARQYGYVFGDGEPFFQDIDVSNLINGAPVYHFDGVFGACPPVLSGVRAGRVDLGGCNSTHVTGISMTNGDGVFSRLTKDTWVERSVFDDQPVGVAQYGDNGMHIVGSSFTRIHESGMNLFGETSVVEANTLTRNDGIPIYGQNVRRSDISRNTITDNPTVWGGAIHLEADNRDNVIAQNVIKNNADYGIWIMAQGLGPGGRFVTNVLRDNVVQNNAPRVGIDVKVCGNAGTMVGNVLRRNAFTSGGLPRMSFTDRADWVLDANMPNTFLLDPDCSSGIR